MKRVFILSFCFLSITGTVLGQDPDSKQRGYHPVSPSAFQFLKYDEMPVSEYTGVPNIGLPLYQFEVDGLTIPIGLSYHAGGIRVDQEASWVGLGWDLNLGGSIVQEINDVDDYSTYTNIVRLRPDYKWNPYPTFFPTKYTYPNCLNTPGNGWSNPYPIQSPTHFYSYMMSRAWWIPINGDFDNQQLGEKVLSWNEYDSEPDIFTANFFGHSLKFMRNPTGGNIIVLNKQGYKITKTGNNFYIITPSGDTYFFEVNSSIIGNIENLGGILQNSVANYDPNSKIWMLTKIVTKNKKEIIYNYTQSGTINNYPAYSEKIDIFTNPVVNTYNLQNSNSQPNVEGYLDLLWGHPLTTVSKSYYHSTETRFFLSSISFPNGQVNFTTSNRNDLLGGKRLDEIQINSDHLLKSFQFNYSYLDASSVGGNTFTAPYNASIFGNMPNLRLKLNSIQDNNGAVHIFTYNTISLPSKNSFAQDYWGFYNGQLTNTQMAPNPARLNIAGLADNGNNNSANITYAQAGILTEIQYPTGGKNTFEYELNQFDNYWVPDFNSTSNQISSGSGLRIHAINYSNISAVTTKKTVYSYFDGKAITPLEMYRNFPANDIRLQNSQYIIATSYFVHELNGKGFFNSNSLGSINGVGYGKVQKIDVDPSSGITNGKTETYFNNSPDKYYSTAGLPAQFGATLPTRKDPSAPENGTVQKVMIYTKDNVLVKKVENTYTNIESSLEYGARIFGYPSLFIPVDNCVFGQNPPPHWEPLPQTVIGYYPIYDIESLLQQQTITDYDQNNNSLTTLNTYGYNYYNQLSSHSVMTSEKPGQYGALIKYYTYPLDLYLQTGIYSPLLTANRLTEVTNSKKATMRGAIGGSPQYVEFDKIDNEYVVLGDKIVMNKSNSTKHPGLNAQSSVVNFSKYDQTSANLLEYSENGLVTSMLWDYNREYLVAEVKNALNDDIAYSSFEGNYQGNAGNWSLVSNTTTEDLTVPTGKNCYTLSPTNTLSKSNLNSSKTYIVSYWSQSLSPYTVSATQSTLTGKTLNGWTYYEHTVNNTSSITIFGSGKIDEVRLFPKGSQMSTFTYFPLIGMQSQCNARNVITRYEYDASTRLTVIRDEENNILKKICYNYAGQPENCSECTNFSPIWQNTSTPLRCKVVNCANTGYQEQEQINVNPCCSTYNQTRWVEVGYNPTACPAPSYINLTSTNVTGITNYVATYTPSSGGGSCSFPVPTATGLQPLGSIPAGTYTLTIQRVGLIGPYGIFKSGCKFSIIAGASATFYNVIVSNISCNSITVDMSGIE